MSKETCMRAGTGLCPRNEVWADNDEPCGPCKAYLPAPEREGTDSES